MGYGALRTRLVDVLCAKHEDFKADKAFEPKRLRLWQSEDEALIRKALEEVPKAVASSNEVMAESEDVEENTGVEAPGASLEPLIGSSITFEDKDMSKLIYVIEVSTP